MGSMVERVDRNERYNFKVLLLDGVFFYITIAFYEASTVIPSFASYLTSSKILIGMVGAFYYAGWYLPQILVANYTEQLTYKKRLSMIGMIIYRLGILGTAAVAYYLPHLDRSMALLLFLLFFGIGSLGFGVSGVPWYDLLGKTISLRRRGGLMGLMEFFGGITGFFVGLLVGRLLTLSFPQNFTYIFLLSFILSMGGLLVFALVKEPPSCPRKERMSIFQYIKGTLQVVKKNLPMRRLLKVRALSSMVFLTYAFYVVYATTTLELDISFVGYFIASHRLGSTLGSLLLGYLCNRKGARRVIQITTVAQTLTPLMALLGGSLAANGGAGSLYAFLGCYLLMGLGVSGMWIGFLNYIYELSSPEERPSFIGLANTILTPFTFLPMIGGVIAQYLSYEVLFFVAFFFALLSSVAALRLPDIQS